MSIDDLLMFAVEQNAADLYLQSGEAPRLRVGGQVREVEAPPLSDENVREIIRHIAPSAVSADIDSAMYARGPTSPTAIGDRARFRGNLYSHLGSPGLVIRVIPMHARTIEELHLPPVLADFVHARRGLTLLSGTTGSGKSSTLAAFVDLLNDTYHIKIITIEDPVEFVHPSKKALISHAELGSDTPSFEHGLRQAMRQAPDVILVGELRDADTVRMALRAAETGHQVFSTVHSANAPQTVERLLAMVPANEMSVARQQLAASLVGVISQRLAVNKKGELWPVVEVLRGDAVTSKYILEDKIGSIAEYVATGQNQMQTFDKHVLALFQQGILSEEEAVRVASNPEAVNFGMRVTGAHRPATSG